MDRLFQFITVDEAKSLLVGTPINLSEKTENELKRIVMIMLHCILNGPVGVNKITNFPKVGSGSIKTLVDPSATNSSWKATCRPVAEYIRARPDFAEVVALAQTLRLFGNLWPLSDTRK